MWLLLTDPVTVAESMDSGEVSPLVQSLAGSIYDAIVRLLRYLEPSGSRVQRFHEFQGHRSSEFQVHVQLLEPLRTMNLGTSL